MWEKPTAKTLSIIELEEAKKRRKEKFAAVEESKTEKTETEKTEMEKARTVEPRTVEKNEQDRNTKKTKVDEKKSLKSKKMIENESLRVRQDSVAAKTKIAVEIEKQNKIAAKKNKIAAAKAILESPIATEEMKQKALQQLSALL